MHKPSAEDFLCCGIDVSAAQLVVALEDQGSRGLQRSFPNRASGHQALIVWLQKSGPRIRVCLEATGLYSLDLALALHAAAGMEVAVLNPKRVNRFAATLCRSKTDPADAQVLAEYARRMPFSLGIPRKRLLWSCAPSRATSPPSPGNTRSTAIARMRLPLPPPDRVACNKICNVHCSTCSAASPRCVVPPWPSSNATPNSARVSPCC